MLSWFCFLDKEWERSKIQKDRKDKRGVLRKIWDGKRQKIEIKRTNKKIDEDSKTSGYERTNTTGYEKTNTTN